MHRLASAVAIATLASACDMTQRPVSFHAAESPPERLSEWGVVYADGELLELNERVMPYEINTPLFSDYALKLRTVWMPENSTATYRADQEFDFPVGTIFSKTFHYEKSHDWTDASRTVLAVDRNATLDSNGALPLDEYVLVETRLFVRYESGWKALPYVWNDAQNDAFLEVAGDLQRLELVFAEQRQEITYLVPDVNQCAGCHTPDHSSKELRLIGPRAWQLNRDYDYSGNMRNQLDHWQDHGILDTVPATTPDGVDWHVPGQASIERRAKAYLDANCAHCHNPAGAADTSALHLNLDAPVDRHYGVCKTPVAVGRGSGDRPYDISPGLPGDSILLFRMESVDPAIVMPELGRGAVHREAVALIREWISGMAGEC